MTPIPLVILGASGHGREVAAAVRAAAVAEPAWGAIDGFLDDAPELFGTTVGELQVLGPIKDASGRQARVLLGVGYPETKARVLGHVSSAVVDWPALIHPRAMVGDRVSIGRGSFIQAGAVLTCDIRVAEFVTVNSGVTINHDVTIARLATLSPGAHIGGSVSIGEGAFVGIGAAVKQGVILGAWCVVGAGAVVIADVPANAVVGGVPARIIEILEPGWQLE